MLPNVWDVASALVFAEIPGCRALATTSSGVAASLGYPDGQAISRDEMLAVVRRIAAAVELPVTADLEAGYGDSPAEVAETARLAAAAGAVGMNLEDSTGRAEEPLYDIAAQRRRIAAAREAGLVVNARVDVYLREIGAPGERLERTVERGNAYLEAGADCLFVIGVSDRDVISLLVQELDGPLNVLGAPPAPPVRELEALGVARVSIASGLMRAGLGRAAAAARELLAEGTYGFADDALPSAELTRLLGG